MLTVMALIILLPFVWLVSTSFDKMKTYSLPFPPRLLPKTFTTFNYQMAINNVPIFNYLGNTMCVLLLSVSMNLFIATLAGFVFSKGVFKGKKILFILMLSSMMIMKIFS